MEVVFSSRARADLREIAAYIADDNPSRAESFVNDLEQTCIDLANMPRAFPLVPRYRNRGYRRRSYRGYLIFYVVLGEFIEIVRILHGARDYSRLLLPGRSR